MEKKEHKTSICSLSTQCTAMPKDTTEEESKKLIQAIAFTLLKLVSENRSQKNYKEKVKSQAKSPFSSKSIPSISISDYLFRVKKYTRLEDSTLVFSLILIDRFLKQKIVSITEYNVHRILYSSIIVSIKFNEDRYFKNTYYAKIGGLELSQLNSLEFNFLVILGFHILVDYKLFEKYYRNLVAIYSSE